MLAARMLEAYRIEYVDLPVPEIGDDQVLLKNINLGVCASDQQIFHGKHKYATFPLITGHEVSSIVEKVGKNVTSFKPGDRVVVEPQLPCNHCYPCSIGRFNVCENLKILGVHTDGCACEYIAVDAWNLHPLPDNIDFVTAALVEPLSVGMGAAHRAGEDIKGANVAVVGAGIIGNFTAQCAKALGAEKVLISDVMPQKLALAEQCGIDYPVNVSDCTLSQAVEKAFGDFRKADIIIDCAASRSSFHSILDAARKSSKIIVSGNFKEPMELEVPRIQRREITMIGHMMYVKKDYSESLRCLSEGLIQTDGMVTQHYALKEYDKAFAFGDAHPEQVVKMMIDIG